MKEPTAITKKITGYAVKQAEESVVEQVAESTSAPAPAPAMSPDWKRPERLSGATYKIAKCHNTPDAAVYVTINNAEIGDSVVPAEIFINSSDVTHHQWVTALTRILSALFRQGGDHSFIAKELLQVHDPKGGCFVRQKFHPSLVAQVGLVLQEHLEELKVMNKTVRYAKAYGASEAVVKDLKDSLQDYFSPEEVGELEAQDAESGDYPPNATLCPKCRHKSVIVSDGCSLCLNCQDSRCG